MSKRGESSDVRLVSEMESADEHLLPDNDTPFIIGVLGDFTGRHDDAGPTESVANRRFIEIDRDNFDAVMEQLNVRFAVDLTHLLGQQNEDASVQLVLRGIDSFHPDEVVKQVESLQALVALRRGLEDPKKFDAAAAEIQSWIKSTDAPEPKAPANLLDTILGEESPSSTRMPRRDRLPEIERFVQEIVRPHEIRLDIKRQSQLAALVDTLLGECVSAVLHDREFQRLEAIWRSLHFLVMQSETGPALKIQLLNISKEELAADLNSSSEVADCDLYKSLSSFITGSARPALGFIYRRL